MRSVFVICICQFSSSLVQSRRNMFWDSYATILDLNWKVKEYLQKCLDNRKYFLRLKNYFEFWVWCEKFSFVEISRQVKITLRLLSLDLNSIFGIKGRRVFLQDFRIQCLYVLQTGATAFSHQSCRGMLWDSCILEKSWIEFRNMKHEESWWWSVKSFKKLWIHSNSHLGDRIRRRNLLTVCGGAILVFHTFFSQIFCLEGHHRFYYVNLATKGFSAKACCLQV